MPKKTFYNLPENMKDEICNAGKKEFSKNSLHDSSVTSIIKELNISKETFNNYFDNLEDFYIYLYKKTSVDIHGLLIISIIKHNGDLFSGINEFFEKQIEEVFQEDFYSYYKRISLTTDFETNEKIHLYGNHGKNPDNSSNIMDSFIDVIDFEKYNIKGHKEIIVFAKMIANISHDTINEAFNASKSKEETINNFKLKMRWLQTGIEVKNK